jgi:predicted transposase YbfD/YdcC
MRICHALFPPQRLAQTCELNRGRTEARCVVAFDTSATRIDFPFAQQAARLTRCTDTQRKPAEEIETEFLVTSRPTAQMSAEQMLWQDRQYWGIETGLHLRLDVIAGEDRSRVRHRNAVMNLAVIRRAVVSLVVDWSRRQPNRRLASMSGFYDVMSAKNSQRAFKLVTASRHVRLSDS